MKYSAADIHEMRKLTLELCHATDTPYGPGTGGIESMLVTYMSNETTADELEAHLNAIREEAALWNLARSRASNCRNCGHENTWHQFHGALSPCRHGDYWRADDIQWNHPDSLQHGALCGCATYEPIANWP